MGIAGQAEVLELGGRPAARNRRQVRALLVLLLVVAGTVALLDWQGRRDESVAVARCVDDATDAVADAVGRVTVMSIYVRPTLSAAPPARLRNALLSMVSASAAPGRARLHRARSGCSATDVWPVHDSLAQIRSDCLRLLDGQLDFLSDVRADGLLAYGAATVPRGRCRAA